MKAIRSYQELLKNLENKKRAYVLIYKKGSENSDCAIEQLGKAKIPEEISIYTVDVASVRDIHAEYRINSAPVLLEFEESKLINQFKGCSRPEFYQTLFSEAQFTMLSKEGKAQKQVTVYTSPTCSWCNTLKTYLRKQNIRFREIDISRDPKMAQELVRRSGQQGVPQTDIGGQIVVGFDQSKINRLLEIN